MKFFLSVVTEKHTGASNGRTHQCGSDCVETCIFVQSEQNDIIEVQFKALFLI
jgi:hypothetical protein